MQAAGSDAWKPVPGGWAAGKKTLERCPQSDTAVATAATGARNMVPTALLASRISMPRRADEAR